MRHVSNRLPISLSATWPSLNAGPSFVQAEEALVAETQDPMAAEVDLDGSALRALWRWTCYQVSACPLVVELTCQGTPRACSASGTVLTGLLSPAGRGCCRLSTIPLCS